MGLLWEGLKENEHSGITMKQTWIIAKCLLTKQKYVSTDMQGKTQKLRYNSCMMRKNGQWRNMQSRRGWMKHKQQMHVSTRIWLKASKQLHTDNQRSSKNTGGRRTCCRTQGSPDKDKGHCRHGGVCWPDWVWLQHPPEAHWTPS